MSRPADNADNADNPQTLTPQQAAALLGVNWRTVRRWIDNGKLEGTRQPCTTTRAAVEALVAARQPRTGEVLSAVANNGKGHDSANEQSAALVTTLSAPLSEAIMTIERMARELTAMARENGRLGAEVGRLEAELAQARREATGDGPKRTSGHRAGVWGRVGLWLRA